MRRVKGLLIIPLLCFFAGCENKSSSDIDGGQMLPDGGPGTKVLEQANLAPATEEAQTARYQIRGRLKTSGLADQPRATNATKEMTGGFVPLTPGN